MCAACHGPAGRLPDDSPLRATMEPADFSDPLFNSREPASDWHMVVAHGGHAMGLSAPMPPQGEALTEEDVRDVVAYVKTLADTRDDPPGEFNFLLPIRTTGIEFTAHAPFRSPAGHRVQSAWYRNCASASPAVATWR